MRKLTLPLTFALFTFLLGLGASAWFIHRKPADQEKLSTRPSGNWEPSFFESLDEHGKGVNLPKLRTLALSKDDLEVRLWYGAFPDEVYGVILRRASNRWTAAFLYGTS